MGILGKWLWIVWVKYITPTIVRILGRLWVWIFPSAAQWHAVNWVLITLHGTSWFTSSCTEVSQWLEQLKHTRCWEESSGRHTSRKEVWLGAIPPPVPLTWVSSCRHGMLPTMLFSIVTSTQVIQNQGWEMEFGD